MSKGAKPKGEIGARAGRAQSAAAMGRIEDSLAPSDERVKEILEERAQALARPPKKIDAEEFLQVITFGLRGSPYLIETRYVREVIQTPAVTPVPHAADFLLGIINIRGELVPTFDLHIFFGLSSPNKPQNAAQLALLGEKQTEFAILVDWVEPATMLPRAKIIAPQAGPGGEQNHLLGLTSEGYPLLDGALLLNEPTLFLQS